MKLQALIMIFICSFASTNLLAMELTAVEEKQLQYKLVFLGAMFGGIDSATMPTKATGGWIHYAIHDAYNETMFHVIWPSQIWDFIDYRVASIARKAVVNKRLPDEKVKVIWRAIFSRGAEIEQIVSQNIKDLWMIPNRRQARRAMLCLLEIPYGRFLHVIPEIQTYYMLQLYGMLKVTRLFEDPEIVAAINLLVNSSGRNLLQEYAFQMQELQRPLSSSLAIIIPTMPIVLCDIIASYAVDVVPHERALQLLGGVPDPVHGCACTIL